MATALASGGCGSVKDGEDGGDEMEPDASPPGAPSSDAQPPSDSPDGAPEPPPPGELGSMENPAISCTELLDEHGPQSGVYWILHPDGKGSAFDVYCEQNLLGGGWTMLFNSVLDFQGNTLAFWQLGHDQRFDSKGLAALRENYYRGSLYRVGTTYVDVIEDVGGDWAVALHATATGIDEDTLRFMEPALISAPDRGLYDYFAAAGWSSNDRDNDTSSQFHCAMLANGVAQHYSTCWGYNLGSDGDDSDPPGDPDPDDNGVGPHARFNLLEALGLYSEPGDTYSRVNRITRFTRWR